jgi:hypothetical protein
MNYQLTRPLREKAQERADEEALLVALCRQHVLPRSLCIIGLDLDSRLDLRKFSGNDRRCSISFSVVLCEDVVSFFSAVLGD